MKKFIANKFIASKDSTIKYLFCEIDSIARNKEKNTSDSINHNEDIVAREHINEQLDSLRRDNRRQLRRAQRAAAESPSFITNIPCSEETFYTFFHVPGVKKAHRAYEKNQRTIESLCAARRKLPQVTTVNRDIIHYFDSLSNAQIMNRLIMIEKLLQQKDSVVSVKQR